MNKKVTLTLWNISWTKNLHRTSFEWKKRKTNAMIILSFLMIENEIGPTNGPLWDHENWENSDNSLTADCTLHRITSDNWSTTNGHVTPFDSQRFSLLLEEKPAFSPIRVLSCEVAGDPFLHFWDLLHSLSFSLSFFLFLGIKEVKRCMRFCKRCAFSRTNNTGRKSWSPFRTTTPFYSVEKREILICRKRLMETRDVTRIPMELSGLVTLMGNANNDHQGSRDFT